MTPDLEALLQRLERMRLRMIDRTDYGHDWPNTVDATIVGEAQQAIRDMQRTLENERARVHTCHDQCQRPLCVAHRRIAELTAEVSQQWQPISTAPRDCTRFIGWNPAWTVPSVCYFNGPMFWSDAYRSEPTMWLPWPKPPGES